MKILYFGTICDLTEYNELLSACKCKPSVSTILFESALLTGFKQNGADMEILSFPMIPYFPKSRCLFWGRRKERLACGYQTTWLRTINVPVLKQLSRRMDAGRALAHWCRENRGDGVILTYSMPPFLIKEVLAYGKRYALKVVAIVPDLPRDMYINERNPSIIAAMKRRYLQATIDLQGEYDGYIYLTDAMHAVVAPGKPYTVVEGITAIPVSAHRSSGEKAFPRAVMYAGMLHRKYGIINLLNAFGQLDDPDVELWLFGDGTAVPEIKEHAVRDQRIRFFGAVNHDTVLEYERKATLLVNPRDPDDEFTRYSFPSKIIEYMLSGTPVLATKLAGIPEKYYAYMFSLRDNCCDNLAAAMKNILSRPLPELEEKGRMAKDFIIREKNAYDQAGRVIEFLNEV